MALKQAKATAWKWFSKYIRTRDCINTTGLRDQGKCCTCNTKKPISKLHAGHFISGRNNAILFDETGVHAQCERCNKWLNGNPIPYGAYMINTYGKGIIEAKYTEARAIVQYKEADYREIATKYRLKYKSL